MSQYGNIFKATFLFGFVQVFVILAKIGINKVVALFLGAEGLGIISLYNSTCSLVSLGAGLGIHQSAVKDLAEARGIDDKDKISTTITVVKKIIKYTALLGIIVTAAISPILSEYTFGNKDYTIGYLLMSLVVGATIMTNGYRAINTGMRQLRFVALSTVYGSFAGLVSAIPFYFFLGRNGIEISLIVSAISTLIIARHYTLKIKYTPKIISVKGTISQSSSMVKMGIALMLLSFIFNLQQLITASFISHIGGLAQVGLYQAGALIIIGYFSLIANAMETEYYPRLASISNDTFKMNEAVNSQPIVWLVLAIPAVVLFILMVPVFIKILYSDQFIEVASYIDIAVIGTLISFLSACINKVLIVKNDTRIFLYSSISINVVSLFISLSLYSVYGLRGLGFGYMIGNILQLLVYNLIMRHRYSIYFNQRVYIVLFIAIICTVASTVLRNCPISLVKWSGSICLFCLSFSFSLYYANKYLHLNILNAIYTKIKKRKDVIKEDENN